MGTAEREGFDSAASAFWKRCFSRRKQVLLEFPGVLAEVAPWEGQARGDPACPCGLPVDLGAEPGACTEPLPSAPFWMDVE